MPNDKTKLNFDFNPDYEYGSYVEIVPRGETSVHSGHLGCMGVMGGEFNEKSIEYAKTLCRKSYKKFVPEEFWDEVVLIVKAPQKGSSLLRTGGVGWKYNPVKEAVNA